MILPHPLTHRTMGFFGKMRMRRDDFMGIAPLGVGPGHGGGSSCSGSAGGQPPLGESRRLYADGGRQWTSPGTAQHRVSASLGRWKWGGKVAILLRWAIEKLLV